MSEKTKAKKANTTATKKAVKKSNVKDSSATQKRASAKKKASKKVSSTKPAKKKATKKTVSKVESNNDLAVNKEDFFDGQSIANLDGKELSLNDQKVEDVVAGNMAVGGNPLNINLSNSLRKKLQKQAEDEGVSLEDFVTELLAESVVLRAWEIVERKNQMRSTPSQNPNSRSGNSSGNSRNSNNRKGGRMSHGRYQSIMDDKATFLEYVRNQERSRR